MAIRTPTIAVNTTPVLVASGGFGVEDHKTVIISNASVVVAVGGPDVTAATGIQIAATTGTLSLDLGPGDELYAVAAGAATIKVLITRSN